MKLRPYRSYRPSGVEWIGAVPEHWTVAGLKRRYDIQLGKMLQTRPKSVDDVEVRYFKARHVQWFHVEATASSRMWASPEELGRFRVVPGDLLVCEGGEGGRCAILGRVDVDHIIQNALHRVRPRGRNSNKFLQYVLRAVAGVGWLESLNDKATIAHLTKEKLGALRVPYAPPSEQAYIVRFLDHVDRRIQRYIHSKKKLIELLEEQKQAIIHQAVTGQIDVRTGRPYPAYRDSGVGWLGEVPKHWYTNRIKTLARPGYKTFVDGDWIESPYITGDGIRLIQTGNIGVGAYREQGFRYISESTFNDFGCTEFQPGDVLICRLGEPVARSCLAPRLGKRMITSVDVCILRPRRDVSPEFLVYSMSSQRYLGWVASLVRGSTRDRVSRSMLGGFSLPIPPPAEQAAVTDYLDKVTGDLGAAIVRCTDSIRLLSEFRTRLVADVVTGKLDVRETAAALPALQHSHP